MRDGPAAGLAEIEALLARGELDDYRHAHAASADCLRRLGRLEDARVAYERALSLTEQGAERRFLERRISEVSGPGAIETGRPSFP
jgi:RNA polymerase sigma-70 factor (ECF subfamily)